MDTLVANPQIVRFFTALGSAQAEITVGFLVAQALGIIVTVIGVVGVQFTAIRKILFSQILINAILAVNFLLLPAGRSGAFICLVGVAQTTCNFLFACRGKEAPKYTLWIFLLGYTACAIYTFDGPISILPFLCSVLFAVAVMQTRPAAYRICILLNSIIWVIYDWQAAAYTSMLTHGFILISTLVAILSKDINKKTEDTEYV